jgi:hypothetical protein
MEQPLISRRASVEGLIPRSYLGRSVLVVGCVLLDKFLFVFWHVFKSMNSVGAAGRNAGTAVDAALGIDIHLSRSFELGFVLLGMDAVGGANFDTERVFNAAIGDYVGHDESISRMK